MTERRDFVDLVYSGVPDEFVAIAEEIVDRSIRQQQYRVSAVAAHERDPEIAAVLREFGGSHVLRPE